MRHPPFCPNGNCPFHNPELAKLHRRVPHRWYLKKGFMQVSRGPVQRYRCRHCHKDFTENTFSIDYHNKKHISYRTILYMFIGCMGIRAMGRALHISPDSVDSRLRRLSHQAMAANNWIMQDFCLTEDLAADGFESFVGNKNFPNNFNILVGCRSQFVYFFNYSQLRRKGRMTEEQKRRAKQLRKLVYIPPRQIYNSFQELLETAVDLQRRSKKKKLSFFTDEKAEYHTIIIRANQSWRALKDGYKIYHHTIPSSQPRTVDNPLFPVNYIDRELRKDRSEFVRKTSRFGRDVNNQMERMALYFFAHNYLKVYRLNRKCYCDYTTHADAAGVSSDQVAWILRRWLTKRLFSSHFRPSPCTFRIQHRRYSTPLKMRNLEVPRYLHA